MQTVFLLVDACLEPVRAHGRPVRVLASSQASAAAILHALYGQTVNPISRRLVPMEQWLRIRRGEA